MYDRKTLNAGQTTMACPAFFVNRCKGICVEVLFVMIPVVFFYLTSQIYEFFVYLRHKTSYGAKLTADYEITCYYLIHCSVNAQIGYPDR